MIVEPVGIPILRMFHTRNTKYEHKQFSTTKKEKPMIEKNAFISEERNAYEEEERNLYCLCGKLKTKCADLYAHTTGGA